MEVNRKANSRDDRVSDAWSFGSNYQKCSQSRKMSIGIVIDSVAKSRAQKEKQAEDHANVTAVKTSNKGTSVEDATKGNFTNDRNKKDISSTSAFRNQRDPTEQQTSPWISTKTLHHEPSLEAITPAAEKPSVAKRVAETCNRSNKVDIGPTDSVGSFRIQTRNLQFDKSKQVKENAATERVGKFASKEGVQEDMPEKEVKGKNAKAENAGSETLRLKLQEILGTVSSQNKQCPSSPVLEQDARDLHPKQKDSGSHVGELPRQTSDTIESDTQSHEYIIRRPNTRSLARKKTPAKLQSHNRNRPPACKEDRLEKNVFLSKDQRSMKLRDAGDDSPLRENGRKAKRKTHPTEESNICKQNNVRKDDEASKSRNRVPVLKKLVYPGVAAGSGSTLYQEKNGGMVQPSAGKLESPVVKITEQLRHLQEHTDQKGNSADKSRRKALDLESDKQSPTFAMKTPSRKSSPGFAPRSNMGQLHGDGHEHKTTKTEDICKVKSFDGLKREYKFNAQDELPDDAGKLGGSPFPESRRIMEEDTQIRFSKPSSVESDTEGSEDSSKIQGGIQPTPTPEIGNTPEQQVPRPNKRLYNKGCANLSGGGLAAASSKGIDCRKLERHLEQNEEDPLTSAITLFAFSLEKVRSKMKSVTNQRSAEILKSVAEKIHMQLQNAESQIQADMGKITSLNKSKRKHVEEVLQEKQQDLNAIYERFKEDVNRHLQGCRSTLESLEAYEVEVKATVEKRKASNKKLLLEAEEAIETQLEYAERRIDSVHHVAREKMRQLKMVVAECLKEGLLG